MNEEYQLQRFADAQAAVCENAIHELHRRVLDPAWPGFAFARFVNCYHDSSTKPFAISSLDEAGAYLARPILGPMMRENPGALSWLHDLDPDEVLSTRDCHNCQSSLTLIAQAPDGPLSHEMVETRFGYHADQMTMVPPDPAVKPGHQQPLMRTCGQRPPKSSETVEDL